MGQYPFQQRTRFAAMVALTPYLRTVKATFGSEVPRDSVAFVTVRFLPIRRPSILESSGMDLLTLTRKVVSGSLQHRVGSMRSRMELFNLFQLESRLMTKSIPLTLTRTSCGSGASTAD